MNLTKEQKINAVKHSLKLIEKDEQEFMCIAFKYAIVRFTTFRDWPSTEAVFNAIPEFLKYKPLGAAKESVWFVYGDKKSEQKAAKQSRIKILKDLLKELSV